VLISRAEDLVEGDLEALGVRGLGARDERADHAQVHHESDTLAWKFLGQPLHGRSGSSANLPARLAAAGADVGITALEALEEFGGTPLDLDPRQPRPDAHVELPQIRIRTRRETQGTRDALGGLVRAPEVAAHEPVHGLTRELGCTGPGLLAPAAGERRITMALPTPGRVPGRLGMANEEKSRGRHGGEE